MKPINSAITIIALVATAFRCGIAGAESIAVKMESAREDSVEHLFQPGLMRALGGPQLVEGLPEIQAVAGLDIHEPLYARLSFEDSPAEPIVIVGQDSDGQDIAFAVADSTAQQLQLTSDFFDRIRDEALYAELIVPAAGQAPEFKVELLINQEKYNAVLHRNLELRLGEADIGGQHYAIALVRDPRFGTYTLPPDSLGMTLHQFMIDRDGDGAFLTSLYGQTEVLEDEVFGVSEPFLIDGQAYKLAYMSATGDQLVIEPQRSNGSPRRGIRDAERPRYSARQHHYRPDGAARQARGHQLVANLLSALHHGDSRTQRTGREVRGPRRRVSRHRRQ